MLIRLRFSNFYSFAEEAEISFELGKKPAASRWDINLPDRRLNKVVAVLGANGSGKTKLIQALAFLNWFICNSFLGAKPEDKLPFEPHYLYKEQPTNFELNFLHEGVEYLYKLVLNEGIVSHESLHRKTSRLFSYVFTRDLKNNGEYQIKQKGFGFDTAQAEKIRSKASLISAAYSYDVPLAATLVNYYHQNQDNIPLSFDQIEKAIYQQNILSVAEMLAEDNNLLTQIDKLLCDFDLGINAIAILDGNSLGKQNTGKFYIPITSHLTNGSEFKLTLMEESSGTQSAFVLLAKILPVLNAGGVSIIDEIDGHLHPHMIPQILDLFMFEHTNPHQAQLIFTCHSPEILNLLRKHQIYLTEKIDQKSEAWRLDQIKGLRADDNLYARYMAGAYGGVPDF